jgi:hypothetical protein
VESHITSIADSVVSFCRTAKSSSQGGVGKFNGALASEQNGAGPRFSCWRGKHRLRGKNSAIEFWSVAWSQGCIAAPPFKLGHC